MIKRSEIAAKEELIAKRHQDRQQLVAGNMRSHGKLWGMDCFSWFNPDGDAVKSAIAHFPFPVVWIVNTSLLGELLNTDNRWMENLEVIHTVDETIEHLNLESMHNGTTIFVNSSLDEALRMVQQIHQQNRILLVTSNRIPVSEDQLVVDRFIAAAKAL